MKRDRKADPKKRRKKRDREADTKRREIKKREREADDPKKHIIIHDGGDIRGDSTTTTTTPTRKSWEDIPHHLLELFLKPLEIAERPNLSRVCKAWGEFKPPPPKPESCFPEIVLGSIFSLIRGDEVDKYRLRSCLGSSHGWLIIRMEKLEVDQDGPPSEELYYMLNLATKDTIQLPILRNHNPDYPSIFLSSAPTDPDCIALMFDTSFPGFLFSKRGCNKWIQSQCEFPLYAKALTTPPTNNVKKNCLHSAIVLGGKFYALSFRGNLVAIDIDVSDDDLDPPTTTLTVLPAKSIYANTGDMRVGYDWFLVESLGKLLVVRLYRRVTDSEIIEVDVLELDFETMSWITVKSLPGDQVLFIGLGSSFSMSGSGIGIISGESNCIYVFDDLLCKISRYTMHNHEMMVCRAFPKSKLLHIYGRFWVRPTFV